mmetsp:Transcript_114722/g.198849  ORF Transcript_114722/g.198849 Transcript_114722/m.198849 type:complete len:200 (+) Transcript_114722:1002-1601(+)
MPYKAYSRAGSAPWGPGANVMQRSKSSHAARHTGGPGSAKTPTGTPVVVSTRSCLRSVRAARKLRPTARASIRSSSSGSECSKDGRSQGTERWTMMRAGQAIELTVASAQIPGPSAPINKPSGARISRTADRPLSRLYSTSMRPPTGTNDRILISRERPDLPRRPASSRPRSSLAKNFSTPCSFHASHRRRGSRHVAPG